MINITLNLSISEKTADRIKSDPVPLEGRVYAQIEALYEEKDFPQSLASLSDEDLSAGLLFLLHMGTPLAKVRKMVETSGRKNFSDVCLAKGREAFSQALKDIEPEKIPEPKIFPDARSFVQREIDDAAVGFRGGWVSSVHLDELFTRERLHRSVPPNKRRDLLATMGYCWHPALTDGRANNGVSCDFGKKSRLYIKAGHADMGIKKAAAVARAYEGAQL